MVSFLSVNRKDVKRKSALSAIHTDDGIYSARNNLTSFYFERKFFAF